MTIVDQSVGTFLENVAANEVSPSGGAVAAVSGAAGAALCEMTCIHTSRTHTSRTDDCTDVEPELTAIQDELADVRYRLLELADADAAAVDEVQAAVETPNDGDHAESLEEALERTARVPLEIAEGCHDVISYATTVTATGSRNAVPDAGTGAFLAQSALRASVHTVRYNLDSIEDETLATALEERSKTFGSAQKRPEIVPSASISM
ncbi:cyclodeaminase/cyclohydrolase family protein [Natronolimnohabitans sp. A-GB9]|uniref:cyclodeaminase/cyclohydrolase family protein n=1 Tax=Natronolimnohabitans sp. A-GB9 TaxID=3069757 RepID=UPI0027B72E7C|nr:cyclodeaminase/cyclohydrolase family protein [Natronolimnohabitans sp. A-GB9]MDQ2052180.1 cyclodeaminase/cyclohydrolase family protein [Natronolimnohabitans sp. A-GB9]